jgi:methionine synthase I (cobalamin-dependent)
MVLLYLEQAQALLDRVDVLLIETSQDLLPDKAALVGMFDAIENAGNRIRVTVQATLEARGTMLLRSELRWRPSAKYYAV